MPGPDRARRFPASQCTPEVLCDGDPPKSMTLVTPAQPTYSNLRYPGRWHELINWSLALHWILVPVRILSSPAAASSSVSRSPGGDTCGWPGDAIALRTGERGWVLPWRTIAPKAPRHLITVLVVESPQKEVSGYATGEVSTC